MAIPTHLLEILACPACDERPPLQQEGDYLVCEVCQRAYPIRDDIPILLADEAIPLEEARRRDTPNGRRES